MLQPIVPLSEDLKMVRILQYVPTQLCVCVEEGWKGVGGGAKWGGGGWRWIQAYISFICECLCAYVRV